MLNIFSKTYWGERDVELYIGKLLRYGVISSSIITIIGGIIYVSKHIHERPSFQTYVGAKEYLRELHTIIPHALQLDGLAIIQLGVAILIATPIIRILFSIVAFAIEKDYLYVIITLIVLSIILGNLFFGIGG